MKHLREIKESLKNKKLIKWKLMESYGISKERKAKLEVA